MAREPARPVARAMARTITVGTRAGTMGGTTMVALDAGSSGALDPKMLDWCVIKKEEGGISPTSRATSMPMESSTRSLDCCY